MQQPGSNHGTVYLVGAGPGDPGLITVRGIDCLRRADLVLRDYLVNPAILAVVSPSAEIVCLRQHRVAGALRQEEINSRMIEAARRGKNVVRLKGGDPDVFGRSGDEIEALVAAGIPYETVPGITAGLAASAYAGIPLTHSSHASAVALVTGQERHDKTGPGIDYGALAGFPGTLVFYMGVTSSAQWSEALVEAGKPSDTPVAIVRRCSWPDQQTIRCTLGTVAAEIADRRITPPAVILVGNVVPNVAEMSWFESRPLFGTRLLVTRPREQAGELRQRLADLGAWVDVQPAIRIGDPPDWRPVDAALRQLNSYDWLVFSSANGVRFFLDRLLDRHGDLRRLGAVRLAAIGPGTAAALGRYHLRADLVPGRYRAEELARELAEEASSSRFLLLRASRGREVLAEQLAAAGGRVDQIVVYSSTDVETPDPQIAEALAAGRIDWVTVTSSAIAESLVRLFGDDLRRARLASISPVTSEALRGLGYEPKVEAVVYTMDGLVDALLNSAQARGVSPTAGPSDKSTKV